MSILLTLISIGTTSSENQQYEFWENNDEWVWPVFFSLSFILGLIVHCLTKFMKIPNVVNVAIILAYTCFIFMFVNGVAGATEKEVSVIVFLLLVPYNLVGTVLSLCPKFALNHWVPFVIMAVVWIPAFIGGILIEPDLWPLVLVETFIVLFINIWAILEALVFFTPGMYGNSNLEPQNFLQLSVSLLTCPIVFPVAFGIQIFYYATKIKKLPQVE